MTIGRGQFFVSPGDQFLVSLDNACTLDGSENARRGAYLAEMHDEKRLVIANGL